MRETGWCQVGEVEGRDSEDLVKEEGEGEAVLDCDELRKLVRRVRIIMVRVAGRMATRAGLGIWPQGAR